MKGLADDWRRILDDAEDAFVAGDFEGALALCEAAAGQGEDAFYFATFLRGDVLLEAGDATGALAAYERISGPGSEPELIAARGVALFELVRLDEAEALLLEAAGARVAQAEYTLGLLYELTGRGDPARHYKRAHKIDRKYLVPPPPMPAELFDRVVQDALAELPEPVARAIENIPVLIEDMPDIEELTQSAPPLSPTTLGVFMGPPPSTRSVLDPVELEQPRIVLFKRNLERAFPGRAQLKDEIVTTVLHEVGHALGLSEDDLVERGLQ